MKHLISQPHIVFSVENSPYPDKVQVPFKHEDALEFLKQKTSSKNVHSLEGHYGSPEKSILIVNPSDEQKEAARALAYLTGQDSHIESDGYTHKMIYNHGPNSGKVVMGRGTTFHESKPKDMYSVLPDGTVFTHNFDFENSHVIIQKGILAKAKEEEWMSPEDKKTFRSERKKFSPQDPLASQLTSTKGVSETGIEARRADSRISGAISHGYTRVSSPEFHAKRAKTYAKETLKDLRSQPKPNLPKSEKPKSNFEPLMKPYASEAQRRWAHTPAGMKALGGKKAVEHWDKESKGKDLPEKIKKALSPKDSDYYLAASEQMKKGLKGDWKKEGYTLTHSHNSGIDQHRITAISPSGETVGSFIFENSQGKWMPTSIQVKEPHRRKGLATAALSFFENVTENKLHPHTDRFGESKQSEDAKALWAQPNRPFGKSLQKASLLSASKANINNSGYGKNEEKKPLNKPIRTPGENKKFKVYVKDGDKIKTVRFGDPNMEIKRDSKERRSNFRARHNCDNPGPKTKPRFWSCKMWSSKNVSDLTKSKIGINNKNINANKKKKVKAILHDHGVHHSIHHDPNYDHFGHPVKNTMNIKKNLAENFEPLQKGKKDILQMMGSQPEQHHHEFANWASKALPNQNWQTWAARHYKNKPEDFTPEVKQELEHFGGSTHIPEVAKVRFDKQHDLHTGMNIFQQAYDQYNNRIKQNKNLVKPSEKTQKVVEGAKPNRHWFGLGVGACRNEGKAMGHCGNVPSEVEGDKLLSLRTEHKIGDRTYHEPHLTFVVNNGFLGEMKGRGNTKPSKEYHRDIANLLKNPNIKGVIGGGYAPENNFEFNDLSPELQREVKQANPNLVVLNDEGIDNILSGKVNLPEKHKDVLIDIAQNPNLDPKHHEKLANHESRDVRLAIAEKPNLDQKVQEKLVNDEDLLVRAAIAKNLNLDPKHHEKLVNDNHSYVRYAIAENPNLDPKFYEKLVNDKDLYVRQALERNPSYIKYKEEPSKKMTASEKIKPDLNKTIIASIPKKKPKTKAILHDHGTDYSIHHDPNYDHFGHPIKRITDSSFKKNLAENFEPLQKGKKDILQMMGNQPEQHHHEFADWASKALPNQNWQTWAARHYKNKPEDFTPKVKQELEHFGGSTHIPEVAKVRFDKQHDLHTGMKMFQDAYDQYNNRIKENKNLVRPTEKTQKVVEGAKPNRHWFGLGVGACENEGKAMGHCGNVPSKVKGDKLLSLRTEHKVGDKTYHEPHLTFISNNGFLGEMKGRANTKPSKEYHRDIANLLKDKRIKGVIGGGYAPENNFEFNDLSPELQKEVKQDNPDLIVLDNEGIDKILSGKVNLPEKHKDILFDIAQNPNLDPKHHEKFVNHKKTSIRKIIAKNPNLDPRHHEKLVNDEDWEVRSAIAKNPNLDPKHHEKLVNDKEWAIRRAIAENPNLDPKYHEKLVNDEHGYIRRAIAENPNLDPRHHEKLVNDEDWGVRQSIAQNPNLDPKYHEKLVNDEHGYIRRAIAENPNLDPKYHEKLVNDENWYVREAIAQNPNLDPKHHEKLVDDENWEVRSAIASKPNLDPKHHEKLVNDNHSYVRYAIAENPNLDPKFYEKLVNDKDLYVRQALERNPSYIKYKEEQSKKMTASEKIKPDLNKSIIASIPKKKPKTKAILHDHGTDYSVHHDPNYDHFGHPVKNTANIKKSLAENFEPLQKGKKDILQMMSSQPERHHHEFADWASKTLPNQNWQTWAARHYKNNPQDFTPEVKQELEHFGGSTHIPEVAKVRFDKQHDLHSGMKMFQDAYDQYNNRIKENKNLVKPSEKTQKVIEGVKPNRHWFGLGVGACENEGKAMGHCGNVPSRAEGDKILSLRTEHKVGDQTYHEPHLTFVVNNGFLGEMKGRGNTKPTKEYHQDIVNLLKDPNIKGVIGGGYASENNFQFSDLSPELQKEVKAANPDLVVLDKEGIDKILSGKVSLPEKHKNIFVDIAKNPNLDPKHQERFVNDKNWEVRSAIAQNPNLDPKHHEKLVNDKEWAIRRAMIENPSLDPKHHEKLVKDKDWAVRSAIAQNPSLDPKHHEKLVNDKNWKVRRAIAQNPNLDPKHHEKLVDDENWEVRSAIASKPNLDPKHHEKLVNDENLLIRQSIARNPNLDPIHYEKLANDKNWEVRHAISRNPSYIKYKQNKERGIDKNMQDIQSMDRLVKSRLERQSGLYLGKSWQAASARADREGRGLDKAIDPNSFKRIKSSHDKVKSPVVDHSSHGANHTVTDEHFLDHIVKSPQIFKDQSKSYTKGISSKNIFDIKSYKDEEGQNVTLTKPKTFMIKPYHGHLESGTKTHTKSPIKGWATLTTKDLLHAADMGHMAEDVSYYEHQGVPVTVHKFNHDYVDLHFSEGKAHPLDIQKIAIMDYLTNNVDRHAGNLMLSKDKFPVHRDDKSNGQKEGFPRPLLIDHERNFQYNRGIRNKFGKNDPTKNKDAISDYLWNSSLGLIASKFEPYEMHEHADDLADWWNNNSKKIEETFDKNLAHIKDEGLKNHIASNFKQRMKSVHDVFNNENYYEMFSPKSRLGEVDVGKTKYTTSKAPKKLAASEEGLK